MDIQLVAEKLFNFCEEKYPELDWNCDFTDDYDKVIRSSYLDRYGKIWLDGSLECVIWLDRSLECVRWQENRIGSFKIWINPPVEDMSSRYEDTIVFENLAYYRYKRWNAENWELVSQYRKVMVDIFNFILDEIQE